MLDFKDEWKNPLKNLSKNFNFIINNNHNRFD